MNKSVISINLNDCFFSRFWLECDTSDTFSLYFVQPSISLRDHIEDAHLWTDICCCKLSVKVFLMLENPFPVPSLCKLNHIKVCFIQISKKITCKYLISFRESHVFLKVIPGFFGPLGKFQHNRFLLKRPVLPNYLSVSCNYGGIFHNGISYHIYQHLTYPMVISNVKLLTLDWILRVPLTLSDYWVQMNTVRRNDFQKECRFQLNSLV